MLTSISSTWEVCPISLSRLQVLRKQHFQYKPWQLVLRIIGMIERVSNVAYCTISLHACDTLPAGALA